MGVMRPWTQRLLAEVEANPGLHIEDAIRRLTPWVPQGHAYRVRQLRMDSQVRKHRKRMGLPEDLPRVLIRPEPHPAEAHRVGARIVLRSAIKTLIRHGHVVLVDGCLYTPAQAPATRCGASEGEADGRAVTLW